MKVPEYVYKPITYYSIHLWKYRNKMGRTLVSVYTDIEEAKRIFLAIIKTGKYEMANIRKNEVCKRDDFSEYSASTPIVNYENNYSFDDFLLEIEEAKAK